MRENITKCDRCLLVIDPMEVAPGLESKVPQPIYNFTMEIAQGEPTASIERFQ